ncbi:NAD(P)-dependent oxidoreductase [Streptomyces sp. CNQ085]|uniref:NAD-dependent epimerase/dehydratase family protein n=1 Tax=Streptomyces sp. CNQ085 TaxID=2886944 RepID=UPI001F5068F6|nr:NAD(P)-dependent oxidoreductase [Streptomyces sp. CNQ085]
MGGTGFIGGAVVRALSAGPDGDGLRPRLRLLSRRGAGGAETAGVEYFTGDLTGPASLRGCCDGVSTVLHLVSHLGRDPRLCTAVNDHGTRALLAEAERAGTDRIVYMSTASVYGVGPHRGEAEGDLPLAPVSAASASRRRAEEAVRKAGGIVLRPNLVYGRGDRWFVPALARVLGRVPVWPSAPANRLSLIAVDDLARVVDALARSPWPPGLGPVHHVNHPEPLPARTLVRAVCRALGLPLSEEEMSAREHTARIERECPELTRHQRMLLTEDHWCESGRIWERLGLGPGPGFPERFATAAPWYRGQRAEYSGPCMA